MMGKKCIVKDCDEEGTKLVEFERHFMIFDLPLCEKHAITWSRFSSW